MWKKHGYVSCNIAQPSDTGAGDAADTHTARDSDADTDTDGGDAQIKYVIGDVTKPQVSGDAPAIIVHCLGEPILYCFCACSLMHDSLPKNNFVISH